MIIERLFPKPIGIFKLGRSLLNEEIAVFHDVEKVSGLYNFSSIDRYILKKTNLKLLNTFINESLNEYFYRIYDPKYEVYPYVTQSWVNYNGKGQSHHKHNHSNSFISGVFYIQVDQTDSIIFYSPENESLIISPKTFNDFNSLSWKVPVNNGDLILFPSSLSHSVESNLKDSWRVSLSFNTFIKGTLGDYEFSNELIF